MPTRPRGVNQPAKTVVDMTTGQSPGDSPAERLDAPFPTARPVSRTCRTGTPG